jgi:hypothetical protein
MLKLISITILLLSCTNLFAVEFSIKRHFGVIKINGKQLSSTMKLKVGDRIEAVGKKSFVQIKNDLGSVFLLRNGELKLELFNSDESLVSLRSGKFFHYFNKKLNYKRKFKVKTRHAIMGVRGTKYMVTTSADEDYLCVCKGLVWAKKNNMNKEFEIGANEDLYLYSGKKTSLKNKSSPQMISMTSKEFSEMGHPIK